MKSLKKMLVLLLVMALAAFSAGCGGDSDSASAKTKAPKQKKEKAETLSTEVDELYQSQQLMLELLVNKDCIIDDSGDVLIISTPDELAYVSVAFAPGIQNLGATASLIPTVLQDSYGAAPTEVMDGYLFGARAKHCNYTIGNKGESQIQGIFAASVINQSLYMMDVAFAEGCTDEDAELILNVFTSMNVLTPVSVNADAKTAAYQSKYPDVQPAEAAKKSYRPVTEWAYLPYYYYDWDTDYDWTAYDSYFYEPDWDYYSDADWWSWGWDEENDWSFYDEYYAYYDESYYDDYSAYYDEGYYSYYDDYYEGDYSGYDSYYDDYDVYSDPGDGDDAWSDPGDTYDDGYDVYSDPGDGYDEWSDPGDYGDY